MRIAVLGLGYVGCVSATCFSRRGHEVIGVDVNPEKVDIVNSGQSPIVEPGLGELLGEMVSAGRLRATTDYREALAETDVSLICVGTPSEKNGSVRLDYVFNVAGQIGEALRCGEHYHVVTVRSTTVPGTLERVVEIVAEASGRKPGEGFGACSNPEFLREGTALADFDSPPYTIIGQLDERSGDQLAEIYAGVEAPLVRTEVKVAELLKYSNNVFHAVKVTFGNEIGAICKAEGIDSHALMEIFCLDRKLNLSPYYLKPGFAFGGSCLPKDVRALGHMARARDLRLPLIESLMPSNEGHVRRAIDLVLAQERKRVGVLGLSFKGDTDDLRESPMVEVVETLIGKGFDLRIYDHNVQLAKLFGANKQYIDERIPHISRLMVDTPRKLLEHSEVVIVGNGNREFRQIVEGIGPEIRVIDFVRAVKELARAPETYEGLCW